MARSNARFVDRKRCAVSWRRNPALWWLTGGIRAFHPADYQVKLNGLFFWSLLIFESVTKSQLRGRFALGVFALIKNITSAALIKHVLTIETLIIFRAKTQCTSEHRRFPCNCSMRPNVTNSIHGMYVIVSLGVGLAVGACTNRHFRYTTHWTLHAPLHWLPI